MLKGFKEFIMRGNVVDLAVAVIIGAAFGQIVHSLVVDVITPILGVFGGAPDFSSIKLGPVGIGQFTNAVVNFLIVAAVIYFLVVVPINTAKKRLIKQEKAAPAPVPEPSEEVKLLRGILEQLKSNPR
ncbi:MAG: large conductance mechanosensitive channel protein MscL [Deltaproteobacteria bacterium]|nr:large conductance mechanosensitive channel protein MscL [Deltaproteobacteria bacterium]MCL5878654.1 large conductance mechanosensitive channel protein MscL [Deltaproteobacteria bacterium]